MSGGGRRWFGAGSMSALGVVLALAGWAATLAIAPPAAGCIGIPVLTLTPAQAAPGTAVTASLPAITAGQGPTPTVSFHAQAADGPVLVSAQPDASGTTASFTVPPSQSGDLIVVATKDTGNPVCGMPVRAHLQVGTATAPPPAPSASVAAGRLATRTQFPVRTAAVVGVAVAAVGLVGVGVASRRSSRRPRPVG